MVKAYNRAKKSLGQNFLVDGGMIARIIDASGVADRDETVLEIGPGRGAMTRGLADAASRFVAIEKDDDLAAKLTAEFEGRDNVVVLNGDALTLRPEELPFPGPFRVVANLPYNIGGRITMHLLEEWGDAVTEMTLMFQREVANRLVAPYGTSAYSSLSVLVQSFCEPWLLFGVPPESFRPVPKVQSAIVRLRRRETPLFEGVTYVRFNKLVHACFASRRKTILNGLVKAPGLSSDPDFWRALLAEAGVDPGLRPDAVPPEAFVALTKLLVSSDP